MKDVLIHIISIQIPKYFGINHTIRGCDWTPHFRCCVESIFYDY